MNTGRRKNTQEEALESFFGMIEIPDIPSDCWNWKAAKTGSGYGNSYFMGKHSNAHRLSWEIFRGDIPDGIDVCHSCDNKLCTNPVHLFLGTRSQNMQDCIYKGRAPIGESNGNAKLGWDKVFSIRKLHAEGVSRKELSSRFNVCVETIRKVLLQIGWKDRGIYQ